MRLDRFLRVKQRFLTRSVIFRFFFVKVVVRKVFCRNVLICNFQAFAGFILRSSFKPHTWVSLKFRLACRWKLLIHLSELLLLLRIGVPLCFTASIIFLHLLWCWFSPSFVAALGRSFLVNFFDSGSRSIGFRWNSFKLSQLRYLAIFRYLKVYASVRFFYVCVAWTLATPNKNFLLKKLI